MTIKISIAVTVASAVVLVAVPAAWSDGQPYRDAGDATAASLAKSQSSPLVVRDGGDATAASLAKSQSSPLVVRDAGDATAARLSRESTPAVESGPDRGLHWWSLGFGAGIVAALAFTVIAALRLARMYRLVH
jgi:hypothetical protein